MNSPESFNSNRFGGKKVKTEENMVLRNLASGGGVELRRIDKDFEEDRKMINTLNFVFPADNDHNSSTSSQNHHHKS